MFPKMRLVTTRVPPLPIAAIPLPDGKAAPLAAFGAVPLGLFG